MSETKTIWHPYPEEKPKKGSLFLVTVDAGSYYYPNYKKTLCLEYKYYDSRFTEGYKVIAWAELPEPYKGE